MMVGHEINTNKYKKNKIENENFLKINNLSRPAQNQFSVELKI